MSWLGLTHKGTEPLYSDEWNRVVDALDTLYGKVGYLESTKLDTADLLSLPSDIIPSEPGKYKLGDEGKEWLAIYGLYGYFDRALYVAGKRVIKDGDPIRIQAFIESAKADIEKIYSIISSIDSKIDAKIERKLLQFIDGALAIDTRFAQRIEDGWAFSASHRFQSVPNGGAVESLFENPSWSGRKVNIVAIEVAGLGAGWIDIFRDNLKLNGGGLMSVFNLNMGSGNQSKVLVYYGGTYQPGPLAHQTVLPGGERVNAIGSLAEVGERLIIPPGYNVLVRITNRAGTATDYSIRYLWWEDVIEEITNASGIDPNDPAWAPVTGWDKVWEFVSDAELTDFATDSMYASVANHRVLFEPPSENYGYIERYISGSIVSKVAVCLKVTTISVTDWNAITDIVMANGASGYEAMLRSVVGDTTKLSLWDPISNIETIFTNPEDWIVVVVDFINKVARVYDRNKNILAEVSLQAFTTSTVYYVVHASEDNESAFTINDVEVDWIAIKY